MSLMFKLSPLAVAAHLMAGVLALASTPVALAGCQPDGRQTALSVRLATGDGTSTDKGTFLVRTAMPEGAQWCLDWNHSVEGFRVSDCYQNHAGVMTLMKSHQPDFAAGLGHTPGRGEQVSDGKGGYWIRRINEAVPGNRYVLRVGSLAVNHRLVWRCQGQRRQVSLSRQAAGKRVTVSLDSPSSEPSGATP